jgi:hypothetical protein
MAVQAERASTLLAAHRKHPRKRDEPAGISERSKRWPGTSVKDSPASSTTNWDISTVTLPDKANNSQDPPNATVIG